MKFKSLKIRCQTENILNVELGSDTLLVIPRHNSIYRDLPVLLQKMKHTPP